MDQFMSEITVAGEKIGRLPDVSSPELLPPEVPLDMPDQDFKARGAKPRQRRGYWIPRAAVFTGALLLTAAFAYELYGVLAVEQATPLQMLFLVLSTIAFGWIALGSLNAALGFIPLFGGEKADTLDLPQPGPEMTTRTALLFPVYHEDPARIAGTIQAIALELQAMGAAKAFDVFIVSDTRDESGNGAGAAEESAYRALRHRLSDIIPVYYRRRRDNHARKAGNIKDWVRRFGGGYAHFVVLDGDSVMSGMTLVRLALAMEREQTAGLIQTVPRLTGASTLLQYLTQFASNVYGPLVAAGLAFWHRDQGNYWGHNAIIRTVAFASAAGLPTLPGRAPFGGDIQSHDFVEAVLLARADWGVHMVPTIEGSYEGQPPTLPDVVARDRRWAQGNLQHLGIVFTSNITTMGRLHLLMGATSYLMSLVWASSLVVGIVLALQGQQMIPSYFIDEKTLFPVWPVTDPGAALRLFFATMAIVLMPKFLGLALEIKRAYAARERRGRMRAVAGVVTETLFSILISPILMVTQTVAVFQVLFGFDSGWRPQSRDGEGLSFVSALRYHRWHMAIGVVMAVLCYEASALVLAWMSPVILGLVLAAPVSWLTSRKAPRILRSLLSTRDGRKEPAIVESARRAGDEWAMQIANRAIDGKVVPIIRAA
ncbi:Glucans biosynthesis glucosyltransferase H [Hyphomicrobium sulfonivorans]|uniref:Glucans biosynthesis glucosyltransferase H n=2 Tax=Hyphomicrobium sulfonivorans TaxID=121290 RepID=A0A109BNT3_HYPSL|nr:Glucans biosynthesis glucosyltransferase H [Hyphomicrobium sulfonivorans]